MRTSCHHPKGLANCIFHCNSTGSPTWQAIFCPGRPSIKLPCAHRHEISKRGTHKRRVLILASCYMLLDISCAKKCYSTRSSPSGRSPRLPHTILCNSRPSSNKWHLFTPWTEPLICDANCQPSHVKLSAPGCITGQTLELTNLGDLETCHFFKNG